MLISFGLCLYLCVVSMLLTLSLFLLLISCADCGIWWLSFTTVQKQIRYSQTLYSVFIYFWFWCWWFLPRLRCVLLLDTQCRVFCVYKLLMLRCFFFLKWINFGKLPIHCYFIYLCIYFSVWYPHCPQLTSPSMWLSYSRVLGSYKYVVLRASPVLSVSITLFNWTRYLSGSVLSRSGSTTYWERFMFSSCSHLIWLRRSHDHLR